MSVRLILADDHRIVRDGLRTALAQELDIEVVAEAENGRDAVTLTEELRPDVVLMDVNMPDLNGIEAARRITTKNPDVRVLALSMYFDKRYVMGMLRAGASGYLLKTCSMDELSRAIRNVAAGKKYLSAEIAEIVVDGALNPRREADAGRQPGLTPREREVLQLVAEGKTTKVIAFKLGLSEKTVEQHRRQIMNKLGLRSVAQLTKYAVREGLTSLEG